MKNEYSDYANINNTQRDIHANNTIKNDMVSKDLDQNIDKLQKTANEISTKTRIIEINQEAANTKNKRINALKIGLIVAFLTVVPLVLAISQHISWSVFFSILVLAVVIYGIYLIYVFTKNTTDPYTSPYTSDYQAFQDWMINAVGYAGDNLTKCKPCPSKCDNKSCDNLDNVDNTDCDNNNNNNNNDTPTKVTIGDNQGYNYYDGSSDQQLITAQTK